MDLDKLRMVGVHAMEDEVCAHLERMGLGDKGKGSSPSRDVDARVAREVMGFVDNHDCYHQQLTMLSPEGKLTPPPTYSTGMNAAMEVVAALEKQGWYLSLDALGSSPGWEADFWRIDDSSMCCRSGTPAMAICLAALETVSEHHG